MSFQYIEIQFKIEMSYSNTTRTEFAVHVFYIYDIRPVLYLLYIR